MLADPKLELRARAVGEQLRCLVCRNESIEESNAGLAHDLRLLLRERIQAGDSDQQAIDFIAARYGDYVLLKPPFKLATLLLWAGPGLMLAAAAVGVVLYYRRRRAVRETPPLSAEERRALETLIGGGIGP
jgi:cytochrome c-type biogenesis protein CcmH